MEIREGPAFSALHQLVGGLKAEMGCTGNNILDEMLSRCEFIKISSAGLNKSHTQNFTITKKSPNYCDG